MIMIEHFSMWVKFVTLSDKSSHNTNHVFLQHFLSRFGAFAECLTDQRSKFRGEFQDLFNHVLINHRQTSRDHPQANGFEERMVQTCKKGLRNICLTRDKKDWGMALPYIAMGYKMYKHVSLSHFTPYFLLFRRHPFHLLPLLLKWTKLWTWTPQPLGLRSLQRGLLYSEGLCPSPWKTCPLHNIETPYGMHTHEMAVTNLRRDNLMLVTLCISSGNLMIF